MSQDDTPKDDYTADARVTRYLNRACRGLWGRERASLRDELSIHIEGLVTNYRMAGMPLDEAVDKALTEMGPATKVSAGIARLNALPLMSAMGLLACSVIAVTSLVGSTIAQSLTPLNTLPIDECIADADAAWYCRAEDWVKTDELVALLEQQGVGVNKVGDGLFLRVPGYEKAFVAANPQTYGFYKDDEEVTRATNTGYVQVRNVLESLATAGIPVSLEGWDTLTVGIADKTFDLTFSGQYNAQDFYADTFSWTLYNVAPSPGYYSVIATKDDLITQSHTFDVEAQEGEVYGVAVSVNEETFEALNSGANRSHGEDVAAFYFDLARVGADGKVSLELPDMEGISFASSAETMAGNGKAVLVRLTGDVGENLYSVVPPEGVGLESQ